MVGIDGGGLRKVTGPASGVMYPQVSPKGDALAFVAISARLGVFLAPLKSEAGAAPTSLPGATIDGKSFSQTAWSPDGTRLAGPLRSDNGRPSGVGVYDIASHNTTTITADETPGVRWLADSRRLVYFAGKGGELVIVDTVTARRTVVAVRLPGSSTNEVFAISPDNRTIYYGAVRAEADIWLVERK
jgi:Tol biopolymer transport system component